MDHVETLMAMKKEIEDSKNKRARLEGELDSIMSQLKNLDLTSFEEAEKEVDRLEKEETSLTEEIEEAVDKLKAAYDWKTV